MLTGSRFVAAADLRYLIRQRETILWVFVMPVVFFYFIGTITAGFGRARPAAPEPLLVLAPDGAGPLADELARRLGDQDFRVARRSGAAGEAARVLTIPEAPSGRGFSDAVTAGETQTLVYRTRTEAPGADLERLRVSRAVYGLLAEVAVLTLDRAPLEADRFAALAREPRAVTLRVEHAGRRRYAPVGFAQAIPGTLVMFTMLVSLTSGAILLVVERRLGLLRRLAAAPIRREAIVAGKWAGRVALATVQIGVAMLTGSIVFAMDWGPALPMVFIVLLSWAAFNASLGLVLGSLARSEAQMAGMGVLTTMTLAALGGCWWPIEIAPRWMQSLAMLLPTGWTMDAMHRLVSFGDTSLSVLPHVSALLAGTLLLGWAGARIFRYT